MVEFQSGYTSAMDRVEQPIAPMEQVTADIEAPIIPISEIGTTAIDQGNILQNFENSIRIGTKKVQFVISGQAGQGVPSSGPSSWGKDVRQAMREKAKATGVELAGIEISPQMLQGLSGSDQQGRLSEENRQKQLQLVRDSIRFAADVTRGGGVDIYSQEFQRTVFDAQWNKEDKVGKDGKWKNAFFDFSEAELTRDPNKRTNIQKYLLDDRDGRPLQNSAIYVGQETHVTKYQQAKHYDKAYGTSIIGKKDKFGNIITAEDFVDMEGNRVDRYKDDDSDRLVPLMNEKREFEIDTWKWTELENQTKKYNDANGKKYTPEEFLFRQQMLNQRSRAEGQMYFYNQNVDRLRQSIVELTKLREFNKELEEKMTPEQQREWIKTNVFPRIMGEEPPSQFERDRLLSMKPSEVIQDQISRSVDRVKGFQESMVGAKIQMKEIDEVIAHVKTPEKYAKEKVYDSYSEMGIDAMRVTAERKLDDPKNGKPLYVGPEIGMASQMYGGHPQEFKELILKSREEMAKKLIAQGYNEDTAAEKAKTHIKGMLDTSHMMMWYKHFARKDKDETDEKHIKRFNEWLIEQTKDLVKAGVVGGVQIVDTITGEHAHLPVGQGAFDAVGMVKAMKEAGFKGDIISEGHGEESLGQGRILTESWRAFGSPIGNYARGQPMGLRSWGGMQGSYFGHKQPITYVAGAYAPSNEWSLWSETPFE